MDEASIVSALQEDLQNYKVKIQIRRKESQLHLLITRSEGDDVDYASIYSIVKARIDKLSLQDASSLIVYGRLAGAKHPEWQKIIPLKLQLPLIELDLEEVDEIAALQTPQVLEFPTGEPIDTHSDRQDFDFNDLQDDEFKSFAHSIENDLRLAAIKAGDQPAQNHQNSKNNQTIQDHDSDPFLDLDSLDLGDWQIGNQDSQDTEGLESIQLETTIPPLPLSAPSSTALSAALSAEPSKAKQSPASKRRSEDFDFEEAFDQSSPAPSKIPIPMPPPISVTRRGSVGDATTQINPTKADPAEPEESHKTSPAAHTHRTMLWSATFVTGAIAILSLCGWLVWDRSVQQKYLVDARSLANQNLNPQTIRDVDALVTTRNQLQNVITQLEEIPNRPTSLYSDAQSEIADLRPKLESFNLKINVEQEANKKIESAKNLTVEAATIVQNPPHRSTIWRTAQQKRQQALQMLGEIPATSLLYTDAQNRLKAYGDDLAQINRWVDIQQRAESLVNGVNPITINQLKQLKTTKPDKAGFLNQCRVILQPQISNADAQRAGIAIANLTSYLCAYFWDS